MRIAFVLNSLEIGGIGSVASLLANRVSADHEMDLILLHQAEKFFQTKSEVRVIENPFKRELLNKMEYAIKTFCFIRSTVIRGKYDRIVIHGEWITSFVYFTLLGVTYPRIYFYDHSNPLRRGQHPFKSLMRFTYKRADGVLVLSKRAKDEVYNKSGNSNISVLDNIVKLPDLIVPKVSNKRQVIYLGRLSHEKAPDVLLKAIAALNDKSFNFIIVGDGPFKGELIELSRSLGITGRVEFLGRAAPQQLLNESSIFVLPSHTENFPLALIEAMSVGLSVIMTDCISWRGDDQFVTHMENGVIVPKDNPKALANALDFLIANEEVRERIGSNALEIRERFKHDRIISDFYKAIDIDE